MELARINLNTNTVEADDVPFVRGVLTLPQDTWADLTDRGYPGIGYWPVIDQDPIYNQKMQSLGEAIMVVGEGQVVRTREVINMSDSEVLAAAALVKGAVWERIKAFRDHRLDNGGYQAAGHWFNSDVRAKGEQSVLAGRADRIQLASGDMAAQYVIGGENVQWKTMDNGYVPMNATLALAIRESAETMTVKTYKAAATHQYLLNLCADPENYDFTSGWPPIFGEP